MKGKYNNLLISCMKKLGKIREKKEEKKNGNCISRNEEWKE